MNEAETVTIIVPMWAFWLIVALLFLNALTMALGIVVDWLKKRSADEVVKSGQMLLKMKEREQRL